jgi:hypothetical protein
LGANGSVMKAPSDGSTPPEVLASAQAFPLSVAVSDGNVYWTRALAGHLARMSVLGGAVESVVDSDVSAQSSVIACPGGVCWTDYAHGTVRRFVACSP